MRGSPNDRSAAGTTLRRTLERFAAPRDDDRLRGWFLLRRLALDAHTHWTTRDESFRHLVRLIVGVLARWMFAEESRGTVQHARVAALERELHTPDHVDRDAGRVR